MANKPLPYRPAAVPTHLGWAHEKTGEQLTSHRNLEPAEGTEDYHPNNRKWMAAYGEATAPAAPENTALPTITGTAKVGSVLTGTAGTWSGRPTPTNSFQWLRDGANISGATGGTYTLVTADAGKVISLKVTATNTAGSATATSANTAVPAA